MNSNNQLGKGGKSMLWSKVRWSTTMHGAVGALDISHSVQPHGRLPQLIEDKA